MKTSALTRHWDELDRKSLEAMQVKQFRSYLRRRVLPFSKHYGQVFRDHGITPEKFRTIRDLDSVPFTYKEDLLPTEENPGKGRDFVIIPDQQVLARQPQIISQSLLKGRRRVKEVLNREFRPIFMTSTTGRSSAPIPFLYTEHDLNNLAVSGSRIVEIGEAKSDDRVLNMFPYAPHLAYWQVFYATMAKNIFCLGTGGGKVTGTEGNIQLIKKIKPTVLIGMPTFLYHVLNQALEEGETLTDIRLIMLGGEKVASGTRRKLGDLCARLGSPNVKTVATYGFTEAKMAWLECPFEPGEQSGGYHLYPDLGIIEIVDPETGEIRPEGHGGEVVFTPLDSRGTVVLRYRTGDIIEGGIVYEPCPHCGRRAPRLLGKISRCSDRRTIQLQKIKGTLVDFNVLEHLLDDMAEVGSWQLEIRKVNDDPLELDELILHVSKRGVISDEVLAHDINTRFAKTTEISPNRIRFYTPEELRKRHKVGHVLKDEKILDARKTLDETRPESSDRRIGGRSR